MDVLATAITDIHACIIISLLCNTLGISYCFGIAVLDFC